MSGCSRCHNINVTIFPVKNFRTGNMELVCVKCLTDDELKAMRQIIKWAYERGDGL